MLVNLTYLEMSPKSGQEILDEILNPQDPVFCADKQLI